MGLTPAELRKLANDYDDEPEAERALRHAADEIERLTKERDEARAALERIAWHELSWKDSRDLARQALNKSEGGEGVG